ncbi:hypothetical protein [Helicobacter pylori]|uniref:hypothetical protein n=1 Tax=Helicobacter pylori TaxID=210 RepID=UPI001E5FA715|nr:hypothetical protein [Helicobacter pylori]
MFERFLRGYRWLFAGFFIPLVRKTLSFRAQECIAVRLYPKLKEVKTPPSLENIHADFKEQSLSCWHSHVSIQWNALVRKLLSLRKGTLIIDHKRRLERF